MSTRYVQDADTCVDAIIERVGRRVVFGCPIGLGKPSHVLNALFRRAVRDTSVRLTILGARS